MLGAVPQVVLPQNARSRGWTRVVPRPLTGGWWRPTPPKTVGRAASWPCDAAVHSGAAVHLGAAVHCTRAPCGYALHRPAWPWALVSQCHVVLIIAGLLGSWHLASASKKLLYVSTGYELRRRVGTVAVCLAGSIYVWIRFGAGDAAAAGGPAGGGEALQQLDAEFIFPAGGLATVR